MYSRAGSLPRRWSSARALCGAAACTASRSALSPAAPSLLALTSSEVRLRSGRHFSKTERHCGASGKECCFE